MHRWRWDDKILGKVKYSSNNIINNVPKNIGTEQQRQNNRNNQQHPKNSNIYCLNILHPHSTNIYISPPTLKETTIGLSDVTEKLEALELWEHESKNGNINHNQTYPNNNDFNNHPPNIQLQSAKVDLNIKYSVIGMNYKAAIALNDELTNYHKTLCGYCGKHFSSKSNLNQHIRHHTGKKPFECYLCGKTFPRKYTLMRHLKTHSTERPFECNQCGKRFTYKSNMVDHKVVHKTAKPFKCDLCGKRFKKKSYVAKHMIVHSEEKPFACNECGKRFKMKIYMTKHMMRMHTVEKISHICS